MHPVMMRLFLSTNPFNVLITHLNYDLCFKYIVHADVWKSPDAKKSG